MLVVQGLCDEWFSCVGRQLNVAAKGYVWLFGKFVGEIDTIPGVEA